MDYFISLLSLEVDLLITISCIYVTGHIDKYNLGRALTTETKKTSKHTSANNYRHFNKNKYAFRYRLHR